MAAAAAKARGGCAPLPVVWARIVHALRGWREPRGELVPVCAGIASGHLNALRNTVSYRTVDHTGEIKRVQLNSQSQQVC